MKLSVPFCFHGDNMFLFIIIVNMVVGVIGEITFTHEMALDSEDKYKMWWKFDDSNITVKVQVNTTGWIGWGLSQNGMMKGADMVIGWVDGTGGKHFTDRHGLGNFQPSVDEHQDYHLLKMAEADGATTFTFTRKLDLPHKQDITISEDTMRVLYSWSKQDPTDDNNIPMHTSRGSRSAFLLDYADRKARPLPKEYKTFDVRMSNLTLPSAATTYWCNTFKLPDMGANKTHLIQVDVVITPGNEGVVHHMLLYQCNHLVDGDINLSHNCFNRNMPDSDCTDIVIHGWAIGGGTFYYPANTGLSLNTPGDPKYFLLEIHYDNPKKRSDIVDSSGLRLYYTDELREYDTSVLSTGLIPGHHFSQIIPQQQQMFTSYGFCSSKCLDIGEQKHYIFSAGLHSHVHGTKMVVRLVNETSGKEVKTIVADLNYDFNYQETRFLKEPIEIPPGHRIDVECTYSTMDVQQPLLNGLRTEDEMCLAYLNVYPKLKARTCLSTSLHFYSWGTKNLGWNVTKGLINSPVVVGGKSYNKVSVFDPLRDKEFWKSNKKLIENFEKSGASEPYYYECGLADDTSKGGYVTNLPLCLIKDKQCQGPKLPSVPKCLITRCKTKSSPVNLPRCYVNDTLCKSFGIKNSISPSLLLVLSILLSFISY